MFSLISLSLSLLFILRASSLSLDFMRTPTFMTISTLCQQIFTSHFIAGKISPSPSLNFTKWRLPASRAEVTSLRTATRRTKLPPAAPKISACPPPPSTSAHQAPPLSLVEVEAVLWLVGLWVDQSGGQSLLVYCNESNCCKNTPV